MVGKNGMYRWFLPRMLPAVLFWSSVDGGAETWSVAQWEQTVYYQYAFEAGAAAEGTVRITAVDEYELFLNGTALGADAEWQTMEEFAVSLDRGDNQLGVRVVNRGRGQGTGLVVELVTEEERWTSNTRGLEEVWRWTSVPQEDDGWLTADLSRNADWVPVQRGMLDRKAIVAWEDTLGAEIVAGYPGGVDIGRSGGGLTLRTVEGENLALGKPSRRAEVFDGRANTKWTINPDELNSAATVDLLKRRLVNAVRVLTFGDDAEDFAENSLLGYAVQVSNDGFQWAEVGVIHGITDFELTEMQLEPILARHVRMVVAEVDPFRRSRVAEIQVLGEGVSLDGALVSEPLDLGQPGVRKNFDQVRWTASIPRSTEVSLQFRSGDDVDSWSDWSPPVLDGEGEIVVPEPRNLLQYRVNMTTEFEDAAPRLDSLVIDFSDQIPVSQARGRVAPNRAVLGRDTLFTYELELEFADGDQGVERLRVPTPSLAEVESVTPPAGVEVAETVVLGDALEFTFAEPWATSGTFTASFTARLLTNQFAFAARLFGSEAGALNAEEDVSVDPDSGAPRSWKVRATDVTGPLLSAVTANPEVLTPNGDGANDNTVIELTLARVSEPQKVEIGIYDLGGRLVRDLPVGRLIGGQYVRPPGGGAPAGVQGLVWDGRDGSGNLVAPGLYVVRVSAELGRGDETAMRTVAVVY